MIRCIERCRICNSPLTKSYRADDGEAFNYECYRCGSYLLSERVIAKTNPTIFTPLQIANISGWLRENPGRVLGSDNIERLKELYTPTPAEKANKLMLYIVKQYPVAGQKIHIDMGALKDSLDHLNDDAQILKYDPQARSSLYLLSITWTQSYEEFDYIYREYLVRTKGYISVVNGIVTVKGWDYLESMKYPETDSQMAFIAMWFDKSMNNLFNSISEATLNAGYNPKRVDKHEHINRIDDEIVSMIRQCKFLVADFTAQRGGVYFESGFALGLHKPVVWLCREDDLPNLHFDTNHYNFILWNEEKLDDLKVAIQYRIERVIGKGTYHS